MIRPLIFILVIVGIVLQIILVPAARKGGRRGGKGKNLFPFSNAASFSLMGSGGEGDVRVRNLTFNQIQISFYFFARQAARLIKTSHFMFQYMFGGKIWLICASEGEPRPTIVWYKDGAELILKTNMHVSSRSDLESILISKLDPRLFQIYERPHSVNQTWSKIEIDPGTLGDSGIYTCYASNQYGMMYKNFKAEPSN